MSNFIFFDMESNAKKVLDHPVDVVWPCLLDQKSYMTDFAIETVSGKRNEEGEIKKVTPGIEGFKHFFFKTLLLVPYRKFVYKAYTEDRSGRYGFTGIEILSLNDLGRGSVVTFEAYLEVQSSAMSKEELSDFVAKGREGSFAIWEANFQRLAALIASAKHT